MSVKSAKWILFQCVSSTFMLTTNVDRLCNPHGSKNHYPSIVHVHIRTTDFLQIVLKTSFLSQTHRHNPSLSKSPFLIFILFNRLTFSLSSTVNHSNFLLILHLELNYPNFCLSSRFRFWSHPTVRAYTGYWMCDVCIQHSQRQIEDWNKLNKFNKANKKSQ